jgi:hypothetical protein
VALVLRVVWCVASELKNVLFPENRETNCLSTKVKTITKIFSNRSNNDVYIRINLCAYSMLGTFSLS